MRISIFTKLTLTSLVIIAGLVSFFAYRTNLELEKSFETLVEDRETRVERGIGLEVELLLAGLESQLIEIANDDELPLRLVEYLSVGTTNERLIGRSRELRNISGIDRLWIVSPDGILLAAGHDTHMFGNNLLGSDGTYTQRLTRALNGETIRTVALEQVATDSVFVAEVFLPITNYDTFRGQEQVDGVIWGARIIDEDFMNRAADLAGAELVAIAADSPLLTSLGDPDQPLDPVVLQAIQANRSEIEINDETYTLSTLPFPGTVPSQDASLSEVHLHLLIPKSDLTNRRAGLLRDLLLDSVFGGLVAILFVFLIAKSITFPIERLKDAVADLAEGDLSKRVEVRSHDEVEDLVDAFNMMADDLEANTRRLVEAEKLSAWREVARRLAHEIKNPLSPIKLSIQNLLRVYNGNKENFEVTLNETGETILEEVDRLKTLADEFSNFARMPKLVLVKGDIGEVIRGSVALFDKSESNIRIDVDLPVNLPEIKLDRDAISRVFTNLLKNAREAMSDKDGKITISGEIVEHGGSGWLQLRVRDEGIGMDETAMKQIFNPYFTTKRGGSGLGLAIVQSIVSDHGGRIRIASESGKGTIVTVELPVP